MFKSMKTLFALVLLVAAPQAWAEVVLIKMETSYGPVSIELYPEKAPITVANFLKYVDTGKYNNGSFYRVVRMDNQAQNNIKIEVIQGGMGDVPEHERFADIPHETTEVTGLKHEDGTISMARLDPGTASSEFFICVGDQPHLDFGGERNPDGYGFAAFGKVVSGMDVVRKIQNGKTDMPTDPTKLEYTSGQILIDPVVIKSIKRSE
ncbi:peptidyl-prolyl cis-trans isomerase [Kordiimonas sediminis]|uniref:Peptidyl-prolyl cis-trans isomerase n=1 Tax=Kordiimonas sediminis TaxID=1735581 RepID=A0A919E5V6_9PROT|nr:peptidylprolyl isomerase [Kordiimonas sediminis]GHF22328.1 peptidyl-prolyl cis-trans isomerase [Kordiimonas sediminis]